MGMDAMIIDDKERFIQRQDYRGSSPLKETLKYNLGGQTSFFLPDLSCIAGIFVSRDALSKGSDVIIEVDGNPHIPFPYTPTVCFQ